MEKTKKVLPLFPNYFKKIGLGIILLNIIFLVLVKLYLRDLDLFQNYKSEIKILSFDILLIGIFIICLSEDKVEDERTLVLRTQSMAMAFLFGIGTTLIGPFISILFNDPIEFEESKSVIFLMLFTYLVFFIGRKKSF